MVLLFFFSMNKAAFGCKIFCEIFFFLIVLLYLSGDLVKSNLKGFINPLVNKELKQKLELVDRLQHQ